MAGRCVGRIRAAIGLAAATLIVAGAGGCAHHASVAGEATRAVTTVPTPLRPAGAEPANPGVAGVPPQPIDLSAPGAAAWGTTPAEIIDTRKFPQPVQPEAFFGEPRRVKEVLPPHEKPGPPPVGLMNDLQAGQTLEEPRTVTGPMFPSVGQTGWNPPDPTLAVGPNHVVVTVNSRVGFFTKAGVQTFAAPLDNSGNPGFFEPLGAGGFCFDPKCFYDHYAGRFVIVVLETYGTTEAWVDIAVSDDSDPNGVWYKYRTNAVIDDGTRTYWWDFPGAGYDQNAYYVTGNLFGLSSSGYGGFGVRVFNKATLLSGGTASYATLKQSGYTVQPALHFGSNGAGYMATIDTSTNVKIWAVTNPLTSPALVSTNVTVPSYTGAIEAPTINGSPVSNAGMTMPYWRNGRLFVCQNASSGGRNKARWHEFSTGTWPTSGSVTRIQSGDVDAGANFHTIFPAMGVNAASEVGMALGVTSEGSRVAVAIAGRRPADPAGRMGVPTVVKPGEADRGGRWGDYYAIGVDPIDDTTFWYVGEYRTSSGWQNWVGSFTVSSQSLCHPVPDDMGVFQAGISPPGTVDVLANDWHSNGATMTIASFSPTSTRGGTVTRSVGTGPGGRDQLTYTPPAANSGWDSFSYTVSDGLGNTAAAAVVLQLFNPASYRSPEGASDSRAGVRADWYALDAPDTLPDFATLTRYGSSQLASVNIPSTNGNFASSGRADNIGAVFDGYVNITASDVYRFYLSSDDGSAMYLGSSVIIDNDGLHGMSERASNLVGLRPGKHRIKIHFFEAGGGAGVIASMSSTSAAKTAIPASAWFTFCAADVNRSGTVTVQDVFDFLAAYFGGTIDGDFNADGGITVQDIFDFLSGYFGGC